MIFAEGTTQGLYDTTLTAETNSMNFTENNNKICLSLHYNETNIYLFVNGTEIVKFKAEDPEIVATPLCLGSERWLGCYYSYWYIRHSQVFNEKE